MRVNESVNCTNLTKPPRIQNNVLMALTTLHMKTGGIYFTKHLANRNGTAPFRTAPFHSSSSSIWIVLPWHHRMWNGWNKGGKTHRGYLYGLKLSRKPILIRVLEKKQTKTNSIGLPRQYTKSGKLDAQDWNLKNDFWMQHFLVCFNTSVMLSLKAPLGAVYCQWASKYQRFYSNAAGTESRLP